MDLFALEVGMDPAEVRRINLIRRSPSRTPRPSGRPTTSATTSAPSTGCSTRPLRRAARRAGRRRESGDPVQLGIGVSIYVEITGGVGNGENAKIEINDDGTGVIYTGTSPHGQGHDTAWSMIASAKTGIPIDKFTLVWGDTDLTPSATARWARARCSRAAQPSTRRPSSSSRRPSRSRPGRSRRPRPTSSST
jgi:carbon-monoxide dehydrogenase large subunit